jgi:hypothetical protein
MAAVNVITRERDGHGVINDVTLNRRICAFDAAALSSDAALTERKDIRRGEHPKGILAATIASARASTVRSSESHIE